MDCTEQRLQSVEPGLAAEMCITWTHSPRNGLTAATSAPSRELLLVVDRKIYERGFLAAIRAETERRTSLLRSSRRHVFVVDERSSLDKKRVDTWARVFYAFLVAECAIEAARGGPGALPVFFSCPSSLVDPASSHMLVSKIKPCMSQCKLN